MSPEKQIAAIAKACSVDDQWVLIKRGLYYRPNASGYTDRIEEAGLYSEEEANRHVYTYDEPVTKHPASFPDYLNSLDAMHEAEVVIHGLGKWPVYLGILWETVNEPSWTKDKVTHVQNFLSWNFIHATTAAQRAEAFLKTLNLWES